MSIRIKSGVLALAFVLVGAAATAGPAAAAAVPEPEAEPSPWAEHIEAGATYRGDFLADDPRFTAGDRQLAAKCAVLSSADNDGFDVSVRRAADNRTNNLITLSLVLEIGTGTCTDFKAIRTSVYDPSAVLAMGDNGRVRFYGSGGDYLVRVYTLARQPEKDPFILRVARLDPGVRARKFEAGAVGLATAGSKPAAAAANAGEEARTAYLLMCGKGHEKLSATTCAGMRRDLDVAEAAQAAAAREAEVMGVYRQVCASGREKLSKETCASMLAEAKRMLASNAAPAAAAAAPAAMRPDRPAGAGTASASALKSAYDELCAPGAQQVSVETCAALRADATPNRRSK